MLQEEQDEPLETAKQLEDIGLKKNALYRLCRVGKLTHYIVGVKGGGIRFRRSEVLAALRVPAQAVTK